MPDDTRHQIGLDLVPDELRHLYEDDESGGWGSNAHLSYRDQERYLKLFAAWKTAEADARKLRGASPEGLTAAQEDRVARTLAAARYRWKTASERLTE